MSDPTLPPGGFKLPLGPLLLTIVFCTGALWWNDRGKQAPGHCANCGYDLTGNESGVCPECGRAVNTSRAGKDAPSGSSAAK